MFDDRERAYLAAARLGRLATADSDGRPHAVPVCFALVEDRVVTPIDEKPQRSEPMRLRRSEDIRQNPFVAMVVDHYTETWDDLGWVQIRGRADHLAPGEPAHAAAVTSLREKYRQYRDHDLEDRPVIRIEPGSVVSWGTLEQPPDGPA